MGMDMRSFCPLQIIFIFFAQCLVIPGTIPSKSILMSVILVIVDFRATEIYGFQDIALTIVVCSLPLSSLWAAAATDGPHVTTLRTTQSDTDSSKRSSGGCSSQNRRAGGERKGSLHSADTDLENAPSYVANHQ